EDPDGGGATLGRGELDTGGLVGALDVYLVRPGGDLGLTGLDQVVDAGEQLVQLRTVELDVHGDGAGLVRERGDVAGAGRRRLGLDLDLDLVPTRDIEVDTRDDLAVLEVLEGGWGGLFVGALVRALLDGLVLDL